MKRRNRMGRQRFGSQRRKPLGLLNIGKQRKCKSWTFERLEDRMVFSASPLNLQTVSFGNDTPEGAALTWLHEQEWTAVQAAAASKLAGAATTVVLSLPNDPLFANQWHLLNTGQEVGNPDLQTLFGMAGEDINVVPAWNMGYTGEGVVVAVIDSGVQFTHPDLLRNISPTLRFNAITGTTNVSPISGRSGKRRDSRNTCRRRRSIGAVAQQWDWRNGRRTNVTIVPIKLSSLANASHRPILNAFQYALQNGVDITNNSWGP